jgi:putative transcriptional regulator
LKGAVIFLIIINLDVMMAKRKIGLTELAERINLTQANLSILKNGKGKAIRLSTLNRLCKELDCQPGDILEYKYTEGEDNDHDDKERE